MFHKMRYRLALDLGAKSLGWCLLRLDTLNQPIAIIKAGVRIFSDGRDPDGTSLAVTRRQARAMRRRRDRLLKRKQRLMRLLEEYNFFPTDPIQKKALEQLNPYELRAKGLDHPLSPQEFARALFHINQRRGFKSNRKTDSKSNDNGPLKAAISKLKNELATDSLTAPIRTVGEWLYKRHLAGEPVRARFRQLKVITDEGKNKIEKSYDLYIDREMVEVEFDLLWSKQSSFNPALFNENARLALRDCLLFQRPLKPVVPGRCTLLPDQPRAPLALPSQQRFRIYQELNNLRVHESTLEERALTLGERNLIAQALDKKNKLSFAQIKTILGLTSQHQFNLEDSKRTELKGNSTNAILSRKNCFGEKWFEFDDALQDLIVEKLLTEENEASLIAWLVSYAGIDDAASETVANLALPEGYGSLSKTALERILPALKDEVLTYDKAVIKAGFEHHSALSHSTSGEMLDQLPYYGKFLQRHVGFGTGNPQDTDEKCYGKIANPTVHIGLNQVRLVVNQIIKKYGHPSEVIIELARDLKQSKLQKSEEMKRQTANQNRNDRLKKQIAGLLNTPPENVTYTDLQKMILWEELSPDIADRKCPYSGEQISATQALSDAIEIEHILPFSRTLDDSLNNKTLATREANRIKGNRTPWEAKNDFEARGWAYDDILLRTARMIKNKRYRFGENGYQTWLKEDDGFLARALNDTRYMSKIAKEYLSLICPQATRAIPGQMTAMLRAKFGLNDILGLDGVKNRDDHRHHAVDACVIGVTDQGMLQKFAQASASARERQLNRLVENMPLPWPNYRTHVTQAIESIKVSHKPDHSHEGAMHNDTAYGLLGENRVRFHKVVDGVRTKIEDSLKVIPITKDNPRHGYLADGQPKPYKGYKGDSNYCIEITQNTKGKWEGRVISTYEAYQHVRTKGVESLRDQKLSIDGKPLIMRLMINDSISLKINDERKIMRISKISGNGQIFMTELHESNVDARDRDKSNPFKYTSKMSGSLQSANARLLTVSPLGDVKTQTR